MRLNGAVFHTDYSDLQVQVFNSVAPVTQKVGSASIDGVELEVVTALGEGWLVEASASYLDAQYDDIDSDVTLIDEDNEFERVPEYAFAVGISKEFSLDDRGRVIVRGDWAYRDSTYNDAYNTELLKTDAYDLYDASVRWVNAADDLSVVLTGRNLGDEEYLVTGVYGTAFQSIEGMYDRGSLWFKAG